GLCWHASSALGLGPPSRARWAISAARSAERSFVPTTPSTGLRLCSNTNLPGSNASSSSSRSEPAVSTVNSSAVPAARISRKSRSCGQTRRTCLNAGIVRAEACPGSGAGQIRQKPVAGKRGDALKCAAFFEQMRRARDDLELDRRGPRKRSLGFAVEVDDQVVAAADDQQRRGAHLRERRTGEVG